MKKIIKKHITKYLLKYFNGSSKNYYYVRDHVKFYLFLRWLSEFVKNEEDTKDVMASIASFLYYKRLDLPFTDIFVVENVVCICTRRPGLWIGKAGCIMDEIIKKLNFNLKGEKIHNFEIQLLETTKGAVVDVYGYMKVLGDY
jgi:hypothetical protein